VTGWERSEVKRSDYILKGMNQWTEHYSVLKAEVEDSEDPGTGLNRRLLEDLSSAEMVLISGQALSHCVANTIRDMIEAMDQKTLQKLVLLEDTTSSVPGFENLGEEILQVAKRTGIRVCRTIDI
jgi:nicotinamidase-related amidase